MINACNLGLDFISQCRISEFYADVLYSTIPIVLELLTYKTDSVCPLNFSDVLVYATDTIDNLGSQTIVAVHERKFRFICIHFPSSSSSCVCARVTAAVLPRLFSVNSVAGGGGGGNKKLCCFSLFVCVCVRSLPLCCRCRVYKKKVEGEGGTGWG